MLAFWTSWLDAVRLGMDVQQVIALRMMRLSSGNPRAAAEAQRMVTEKVAATLIATHSIALDIVTGQGHLAAARAMKPLRRRVRENRRRLSRG